MKPTDDQDILRIRNRERARGDLRRLVAGQGRYVDDLSVSGMLHAAFVRSVHAFGRIRGIDASGARSSPDVVAVFTGDDFASICKPFRCEWRTNSSFRAPFQEVLPRDTVHWHGQAVAVVVAETRAAAMDAADLVALDIEPMDAVTDPETALEDGTVLHPTIGTNLAAQIAATRGSVESGERPAHTVRQRLAFGRITGVSMEPRGILASYDPATQALTVWQSHQAPYQQQLAFGDLLGLPDNKVRVLCPDVGGAFGVKLHTYPDELAIVAATRVLGRPVKFVATRSEAFLSDVHARELQVDAELDVSSDGRFLALRLDGIAGLGAFSIYPRTSLSEGAQVVSLTGSPYVVPAFEARVRFAYQNKAPVGAVRAVGHPLAATVMEQMVDGAAHALGIDPVDLRLLNLHVDDQDAQAPSGAPLGKLSLRRCLSALCRLMDYPTLRQEQARLREAGVFRGIGMAVFSEVTGPGPMFYGPAGVQVSTQDGCVLKLEASGAFTCLTSSTDQGQGTLEGIRQIVADALFTDVGNVSVIGGDTRPSPYGGGAWASRGVMVGGEAALLAAEQLKANILEVAEALLGLPKTDLAFGEACVVSRGDPDTRVSLRRIAEVAYFEAHLLPAAMQPQLCVAHSYTYRATPYLTAVGAQGSLIEIDAETGHVKALRHWVVEDCGRVINGRLLDDQLRGGVAQGIGAALYEQCVYDSEGQLTSGSLLDYHVPIAHEIPEILIEHVETPTELTKLGAKGGGEAGAGGAPAAVRNAVNDALTPFGGAVFSQPIRPEEVLAIVRSSGSVRNTGLLPVQWTPTEAS